MPETPPALGRHDDRPAAPVPVPREFVEDPRNTCRIEAHDRFGDFGDCTLDGAFLSLQGGFTEADDPFVRVTPTMTRLVR